MVPFAAISDIHGDLDDLKAVLARIGQLGIKRIVCLGDIIGRGGAHRECFDIIMSRCEKVLAGNHDVVASGAMTGYKFPERDQEALIEARGEFFLDDDFGDLPVRDVMYYYDTAYSLVHASPIDPVWEHIGNAEDARGAFAADKSPFILFGHTHRACWADTSGSFEKVWTPEDAEPVTIAFKSGERYLLNPGAVIDNREFMIVTATDCTWHKA